VFETMRHVSARNVWMTGLMLLALSAVAWADPLPDCNGCFSDNFFVTCNAEESGDICTDSLKLNPREVTPILNPVNIFSDFKISTSDEASNGAMTAAPGGMGNGTPSGSGLSFNACEADGSGFFCAQGVGSDPPLPFAGTYTWEFNYGTPDGPSVGAIARKGHLSYVDRKGEQAGALSNGISLETCSGIGCVHTGSAADSPVPEPGSIVLLGSVICVLAIVLKRRVRAQVLVSPFPLLDSQPRNGQDGK
jgi:hypothetical protein